MDLHAGLNVGEASMSNYEAAAYRAAGLLPRPVATIGWSMGGLVALMAARRVEPAAVVLLEPSPPAEVQGTDEGATVAPGRFDPEEVYGPFPPGVAARAESSLAREERRRGVSVPREELRAARVLVVSGDEFAQERGVAVAKAYCAEHLHAAGVDHWDLVLGGRVRAAVARWLSDSGVG